MNAKSFNKVDRKMYIVTENPGKLAGAEDLKIMEVQSDQEAAFHQEYAGRIVAEGSSIQELLIKFSEITNGR